MQEMIWLGTDEPSFDNLREVACSHRLATTKTLKRPNPWDRLVLDGTLR